jgi:hypothetical protein
VACRGKLLNVRDASASQITNNAEITNIKQIMGLQYGKVAPSATHLRQHTCLSEPVLLSSDQSCTVMFPFHVENMLVGLTRAPAHNKVSTTSSPSLTRDMSERRCVRATWQDYSDVKQLRYGHLMIMTDQDHDGSHIKGLIMNFLHHFYPSLLKVPGFLVEFITPIIKVTEHTTCVLHCVLLFSAAAKIR